MGSIEGIVKASQKDGALVVQLVGEDTEELLGQGMLGNTVVVVEPCLGAPADVQGRVDAVRTPFHNPA